LNAPVGNEAQESLFVIKDRADALRAIDIIVEQGEGTEQDPFSNAADNPNMELAHYYRFEELLKGRRLVRRGDGKYAYEGQSLDRGQVVDVAPVPDDGYPNDPLVRGFNRAFQGILVSIEQAWATSQVGLLMASYRGMSDLSDKAKAIMRVALPDGRRMCPDFRLDHV
jgi:hypothetical protein